MSFTMKCEAHINVQHTQVSPSYLPPNVVLKKRTPDVLECTIGRVVPALLWSVISLHALHRQTGLNFSIVLIFIF